MALPVDNFLPDVEDEGTSWFEHALELRCTREEPLDVFVRVNTSVGAVPLVRIRRRGHDELDRLCLQRLQNVQTITLDDLVHGHRIP